MRVLSAFFCIVLAAIFFSALVALAQQQPTNFPPPPASCFGPGTGRGAINCRVNGSTSNPPLPPVYTSPPTFLRSVKNGKLYLAGENNDTIDIVHLFSETDDLYEMGYAFGQLMPEKVTNMFLQTEPYLVKLLENAVPNLPPYIADLVIKYGGPFVLDVLADLLEKSTPQEFINEWQGIADGATAAGYKCTIRNIEHVALLPQLSKASCSALSSINEASENGHCIQLRTLDFAPQLMIGSFSSVVVYHYNKKPMLANFGYTALTGCLSCVAYNPFSRSPNAGAGAKSSAKGSVIFGGEKDWGYKNPLLPLGYPWMQLFRESLSYPTLEEIDTFLQNYTNTTLHPDNSDEVAIHLLFTHYNPRGQNGQVGWEIGWNHSQKFDWYTHVNGTLHQDRPGLIFWTKNDDPFAHTPCTNDMLQGRYGQISADWFQQVYSPSDLTGDSQVVSMDLTSMLVFVSNSRKANVTEGYLCAYYRRRNLLDMQALFDEEQ